MDRNRRARSPKHSRQWSGDSSTGSSSPVKSPANSQSRLQPSTGKSFVKRNKNAAAKAALELLKQAMIPQGDYEDEEDDDRGFRFGAQNPPAFFSNSRRNNNGAQISSSRTPNRSPSPAFSRNVVDHTPVRSPSAGRPSKSPLRSPSAGRPSMFLHPTPLVRPSRSSLNIPVSIPPIVPPSSRLRERRFGTEMGHIALDTGNLQELSALHDEFDMLQEDNVINLDKLRHAEQELEKAEARTLKLEKQVAALGEGVSFEAKLLSRKEAVVRQREAALKAAKKTEDRKNNEIFALRGEIENLKNEIVNAAEQLEEAEYEAKAFRTMTRRMILTHEEMEEVVLKRCWLAHYWGLAVQYGICADIAASKHDHWSSLAPLPFEVVISAGQKAKEESLNDGDNDYDRSKLACDLNDLTGEGNIETMLSVEMDLRELASLKVEEAVIQALARYRRPSLARAPSDVKSSDELKLMEAIELSHDESEDVLFKEAWLTYFWRRAKAHGVEEDIAEERLQFWISRSGQSPTSHDAVDVERGLIELRKLGIEQQLWEASRKEGDQASSGSVGNTKLPSAETEASF